MIGIFSFTLAMTHGIWWLVGQLPPTVSQSLSKGLPPPVRRKILFGGRKKRQWSDRAGIILIKNKLTPGCRLSRRLVAVINPFESEFQSKWHARSRSRSRDIYFSNASWRNTNNQSQPSFTQHPSADPTESTGIKAGVPLIARRTPKPSFFFSPCKPS